MVAHRLDVKDAAALMGVSAQYIRIGIQQGILPFGCAVKVGGERYTYYISPQKFAEYIGVPLEMVMPVVIGESS